MQIKILDRKPNEIVIEVEGEGHTLCNLLESVLLEDEEVDFAGYNIAHPLIGNPIIRVRTKTSETPENAIIKAVEKILKRGRELKREFEKVFKSAR